LKSVWFVGVSTTGSLIHRVFPEWMNELGVVARINGVDLPIDCSPSDYRSLLIGFALMTNSLALHLHRQRQAAAPPGELAA